MGKPAAEIKKKESFKSPISPIWLGRFALFYIRPVPEHTRDMSTAQEWGWELNWNAANGYNRSSCIRCLRRSDI